MIYLIDASVYIFRAWHSMPPHLMDADGNATQALFGFACFLGDLLERRQPEEVAVAFDDGEDIGFRKQLYPAYKANREPMPVALRRQFALCREYCRHLGVAEFASSRYEADDLIGTLAQVCRADGMRVTLVTRDKDLAQLIGPGDVFWDYSEAAEYRYEQIAERFGVPPEAMADYLALRGDSVDNVTGVPGVGHKTAVRLMQEYGSIDAMFERLETVADLPLRGAAALVERLRQHRDTAYQCRELTRIVCNAPIEARRADLRRQSPNLQSVSRFCDAHGFGLLLRRQAERLAARHAPPIKPF